MAPGIVRSDVGAAAARAVIGRRLQPISAVPWQKTFSPRTRNAPSGESRQIARA